MKTGKSRNPTDIAALARAHSKAAIQVLAEIMNDADVPAGARLAAAKVLLDRGCGKVAARPAKQASPPVPVKFKRVRVYPRQREQENASSSSGLREEPAPAKALPDLRPVEDSQPTPVDVGAFSDFPNPVWDG